MGVFMKKIVSMVFLCVILVLTGCTQNVKSNGTGQVNVTVLDGFSGLPVEQVKVVVPECAKSAYTDSSGKCTITEVPVVLDERYPVKQGYGTFSLLGYKEGYNDYALFFAQIKDGETRNLKIYMFKLDTPFSSGTPLSTIESPDQQWVKEILDNYR